jgi:hypothetical protein
MYPTVLPLRRPPIPCVNMQDGRLPLHHAGRSGVWLSVPLPGGEDAGAPEPNVVYEAG